MEREAWIIDAVRSPRGKGKENGALHPIHPQRILAQVLNALQERNGFDTNEVDDVVMGCGAGSGDHSMDIARMAALDAGWSIEAPGVTLNRFCGSGQQAVNFAAIGVLAGFQDLVVGGGVESMSRPSPMHVDGFTANNAHLREQYAMVAQGISADLIATTRGLHPRGVRRASPSTARTVRPRRHRRGPLRASARADLPRRRHAGARPRRVPAARHHARRPGQAAARASPAWVPTCRRDRTLTRRSDGAARLPAARPHRPRPPRRQLVRRRRRRVGGAGRLARLRPGARHDAARPDRHDAPSPAPSRSSC